jgi:hypothetical protein
MSTKPIKTSNIELVYSFLPDNFTRKQGVEVCTKTGVKERSADYILSKMVEKGLIRKVSHGNYAKILTN